MGMNAVLMAPANVFLEARLPPRRPPPWSALRKPFGETRYLMMLIGSCVVMLKYVPLALLLTFQLLHLILTVPLRLTSQLVLTLL